MECQMECGHTVRLSLPIEKMIGFCRFDGWQNIVEIFTSEYRVVCCHCTWGRWCRQSRVDAHRRATHHEHNRPGHITVIVLDHVTKQGGTPRQKIVTDTLRRLQMIPTADKIEPVKQLPPPF